MVPKIGFPLTGVGADYRVPGVMGEILFGGSSGAASPMPPDPDLDFLYEADGTFLNDENGSLIWE